jgi:hypothetical protein
MENKPEVTEATTAPTNPQIMEFAEPRVIRILFTNSKLPQVFEDIVRATVTASLIILTDEHGSSFIRKGEWVEFDILADYVPDNFYGSENEFVDVMNAYDEILSEKGGKAN